MTANQQDQKEVLRPERRNERVEIRIYTPADFPGIVNLQNTIYPDRRGTVQDYIDSEKRRDPKCRFQRWLAVVDGNIVGAGLYQQFPWAYHPQKFHLAGGVLPEWQGQGIGTRLYDEIMADLEPFEPVEIRVNLRENYPQSLDFFKRRGFVEHHRDRESHLDVTAFDPSPYAGLEAKLRAQGIEIKTFPELEGDPDRDHKLYEMDWELLRDMPNSEDLTQVPFERWRKDIIEAPMFLPDANFVAVAGDDYVGLSNLWNDRSGNHLNTGLTGVKRAYRRRGIATALKVRAIGYACDQGHPLIKTDNEQTNRPMLSINERLGFVRQPDWITLKKVL